MSTSSLTQQTGVRKYRAIPEDFQLTVMLDERGCPYTTRVSLTVLQQSKMSAQGVQLWTSHCADELRDLFHARYNIDHKHLVVMSSYNTEGCFEVWLRSRVPLPKQELAAPVVHPALLLSKPDRRTAVATDVIDI